MEIEIYPLPDWAERLNKDKELIPGTQLMTKDGMRIGNGTVHQLAGSQAFPAPAGHLGKGSGHWPATQLLRQDSGAKGMTKSVLGAGIPGTVRVGLLRDVVRTLGEARQAIPFVRDRLCQSAERLGIPQ